MNTFLMIVGFHAVLIGLGLLCAGWLSLVGPNAEEIEAARKEYEAARAKGRWQGLWHSGTLFGNLRQPRTDLLGWL